MQFSLNTHRLKRFNSREIVKHRDVRAQAKPKDGKKSAAQQRKARNKEQVELQDLLIDPAYDPLFDGIEEEGGPSSSPDPFQAPSASSESQKKRIVNKSGRPVGSARVNLSNPEESSEDYLMRRQQEKRRKPSNDKENEDFAYMFHPPAEPEEDVESYQSAFEYQLRCMRQTFIQQQQEEVMEMHHRQRATEVSPFAQATALASLMDFYEKQDETSEDIDPLPSWIRAKKTIGRNWNLMEQLAGSRKDTIRNLQEFSAMTPERQQLLDTWDASLYEGVKDPEEVKEDYMDRFLMLPDSPDATPAEIVEAPTAEDWSKGIMPDFDDEEEEEENSEEE